MGAVAKVKWESVEKPFDDVLLEKIRQHLVTERERKVKGEGGQLKEEDLKRIRGVAQEIPRICGQYREAIFDRVHSECVEAVTADFESLKSLVKPWGKGAMTDQQNEKVRNRVKGFHHSSRAWIGHLPFRPGVKKLPDIDGASGMERAKELKALWTATRAAFFLPPPRQGAWLDGAPAWLQVSKHIPKWMLADGFGSLRMNAQTRAACSH